MAKGKIVHWKAEQGFGFIQPRGGGGDIFLHIGDLRHDGYEPQIGDEVSFSLKQDSQGRPRAARAVVAGVPRDRRERDVLFKFLVPTVFLVGIYVMEDYRSVLFAYLGMSIAAFIAYAADKVRAKSGGWRTPEATLQWLGFLGGWPGAILAQVMFRHKTSKPSFQTVFWTVVALHVGFWGWLQITGLPPDELLGYGLELLDSIQR